MERRLTTDEARMVVHEAIAAMLPRLQFDADLDKVSQRRIAKAVGVWANYHQEWADKIVQQMEGEDDGSAPAMDE